MMATSKLVSTGLLHAHWAKFQPTYNRDIKLLMRKVN
jgi:hypothetical protein